MFGDGGKVSKIVGLDPASPLFSLDERDTRLSDDDAEMVEIIHTNAGVLGFASPIGHISFYPNGGFHQAGCMMGDSSCSHSRAVEFYAESINSPDGFYGWKCHSFWEIQLGRCRVQSLEEQVQMGADVKHKYEQIKRFIIKMHFVHFVLFVFFSATGIYYLQTNGSPPFAKGPQKTKSSNIIE